MELCHLLKFEFFNKVFTDFTANFTDISDENQ